jgi:O-antigen/teichoic acid export membrane protein
MIRSSRILRNIFSTWAGFAINAGVTLVLTPFVLRELGTARYGIWILTSSIIGYYGFLDLGFRAGVTQYLTRYLGVGDRERASECISSAVAVLGLVGVTIFGLSLGAASLAPRIFDLPAGLEREAFWCIVVVGGSAALQFALSPFTSIFTATQRFDLATGIGISTRLLTATGIVATLKAGYGLVGVSAATCLVSAIDYLVRWRVSRSLAPELEVSRRHISLQRIREIGVFGAWNALIAVNAFVYQHVPNLLIGTLMPIAAVGHYALATGLTRHLRSVLSPIGQVIYPAAAQVHARGDRPVLERLYHDGSRLVLLAMVAIVLPAAFWANDFYRLWIGEKYLSGETFHSVALLFQILLASVATSYSSGIAAQILVGAGHVRMVAIALVCGSALNLGISLALVGEHGLAGVAVATVTASVIIDLVAVPFLLQRTLGLSYLGFLRRACGRPAAVAVLLAVAIVLIRLGGTADDFLHLAFQGLLAGTATALIVLSVGITAAERHRYLIQPFGRLAIRERPAAEASNP